MKKSALAHFRQLCCLGLGGPAVMPSLLAALHEIVPSETNSFFWADEAGRLIGFLPEYMLPEVVEPLIGDFEGLMRVAGLPASFALTMRVGRPVGNFKSVFTSEFYKGDFYNLIYRPYDMYHGVDCIIRESPSKKGMGALFVGRSKNQPHFSSDEENTLVGLIPYIAHALHPQERPVLDGFELGAESGLVVLDRSKGIAYASARAKEILHLASNPAPENAAKAKPLEPGWPMLRQSYENLMGVFRDRDAAPPTMEHSNAFGRFVYRAHWLDAEKPAVGELVSVTIQHHEPAALVFMRQMHAAGLSTRQKEVGLLLAGNRSFAEVGAQLHVTQATAKDYAQRIYRKLDVHSREDFVRTIRERRDRE
ncbi:MAG: helix-turn-helix transcriptional regulator [Caldimonas sp.]